MKAAIYGLLRLVSKTCKVSSTKCKKKCYDKRILSIKRTVSLKTSLLNICLGCLASSSHDRFKRGKSVTLVKGNVHYVFFFSRIRIRKAKTDQFFSSVILAPKN